MTFVFNIRLNAVIISTHTLTWSVTDYFAAKAVDKVISTHTLTWSVTFSCGGYLTRYINFNSHAHVERDAR